MGKWKSPRRGDRLTAECESDNGLRRSASTFSPETLAQVSHLMKGDQQRSETCLLEGVLGFYHHLRSLGIDVPCHSGWCRRNASLLDGWDTLYGRRPCVIWLDEAAGKAFAQPRRMAGSLHL